MQRLFAIFNRGKASNKGDYKTVRRGVRDGKLNESNKI